MGLMTMRALKSDKQTYHTIPACWVYVAQSNIPFQNSAINFSKKTLSIPRSIALAIGREQRSLWYTSSTGVVILKLMERNGGDEYE